ncbi:MAG: DNA-3-methyladenine glycosylase [Candidatus Limnocylindrales bacterium]
MARRSSQPAARLGRAVVDRPDGDRAILDRALLAGPTLAAGRALLCASLVRDDASGRRVGRIVEVEAYIGEADRASHARFGPTRRNGVMFGPPGHAYVYLVYGMHACLNVVTEPDGSPAALLIRAVEPLEGSERMRADRIARASANRRATPEARAAADAARITGLPDQRLASGPGLVAAAFGLDTSWTGSDLCDPTSPLRLETAPSGGSRAAPVRATPVRATPRIGIGYAGEPWISRPWRLCLAGHPSVSVAPGPR